MARCSPQAQALEPALRPETARSADSLERIATVLGVPVTAFFPEADRPDETIAQAADLVTAFAAIGNPAARRTCLAFVRAMSSS
ncbi:hypothetical protein [Methylobacterium sp. CM6257]|jgi:transcriptional regulator with XRE-family HTH domain